MPRPRLAPNAPSSELDVAGASGSDVEVAEEGHDPGDRLDDRALRHLRLEGPEVGDWSIVLPRGRGKFDVQALARSDLQIGRFAFVTLGGRIGHEGFVALAEAPLRKSSSVALARLTGSFTAVGFEFVDEKGDRIDSVSLFGGDPDAGTHERIGLVRVPNGPFRFAIEGADADGARFRRVSPTLIEPTR